MDTYHVGFAMSTLQMCCFWPLLNSALTAGENVRTQTLSVCCALTPLAVCCRYAVFKERENARMLKSGGRTSASSSGYSSSDSAPPPPPRQHGMSFTPVVAVL